MYVFMIYLLTLSIAHAAKKDNVLFVTGLEGPRGGLKV